MKYRPALHPALPAVTAAALLTACAARVPLDPPPQAPAAPPPAVAVTPQPQVQPQDTAAAPAMGSRGNFKFSAASSAREYRKDAANHLYEQNGHRIFKGKLPPLLYAVGVLTFEVDAQGRVQNLDWMRAPTHAPEVIREIERTVRAAEPYPVAARMGGRVKYTDTWLWHKSGRFQLDTLTEGQLDR